MCLSEYCRDRSISDSAGEYQSLLNNNEMIVII
jgi:hypothetical protein